MLTTLVSLIISFTANEVDIPLPAREVVAVEEKVIDEYKEEPHEEVPLVVNKPEIQSIFCSCIKTARKYGRYHIPYNTNAEDLEPNTTPHAGSLLLIDYEGISGEIVHHAAVIEAFDGEHIILGDEGNYKECAHTKGRKIPLNDPRIRGFWKGEIESGFLASQ